MRMMLVALVALSGVSHAALAAENTRPSAATEAANAALAATLNFDDKQDFDFATRGLIAKPADSVIRNKAGDVIRNFAEDAQFKGATPATVNPSLWRNGVLNANYGLFEVVPGIYQIRGFDLSNMTIIVGKTGYVIVDPLTTAETAAAGLALMRAKFGNKPVTGMIYTHSHADHFGGARGVVDAADVKSGKVPIYAPQHFMQHAISENVIAGNAMGRRADYMFGNLLDRGPDGIVSNGLGAARAGGTVTLIPPTHEVTTTGETAVIDGVRFEFQMAPNSEAPAEMNFYLPDFKALCMAETANGMMHNVLTPRGALVRDSKEWSGYLTEALRRYGDTSDVVFTSHLWPRWGNATIKSYLAVHRDAYKYLHDQSVRMMNMGMTGPEIAEAITLPPVLARAWFNRGNYGSLKFNSRAVYQRYMGFFDGNPTSLDPLTRVEAGKRYVAAIGGAKKVLALAATAHKAGDYRWEATLLTHLVFAEPDNMAAKQALAGAYDQMAYQAESGPQRNFYLTGALELRHGMLPSKAAASDTLELTTSLPLSDLLDAMAIRVVPERALDNPFSIKINLDNGENALVTVENGVMFHEMNVDAPADATITAKRMAFLGLIGGVANPADLIKSGALTITGDRPTLARFTGLFEAPKRNFPIVTPLVPVAAN
ncbi:MBL fold metallo-hydrolase [Polymorphobacter arshaanensis]|uniref:MBL fold metallo-hydrolase n=1 Tax=Glacieibacterium arshaanense TaxID=2511025 RepID=A0A4Y9EK91_9SPHN|nr:alkyl sulfatase dimerization domain-containing protein [Polymorphobacter arshaanensis]TFU00421.1 MBL fold metallo-hydrolase [Polymorphobacter arshaanensis]